MLVQHFPINPDTNVEKLLNNILPYGCSQIKGNISIFYKTVSKNLSTLVNRAPINKCKKKVFCTCKKVIKMSESVKKRYKDSTILS